MQVKATIFIDLKVGFFSQPTKLADRGQPLVTTQDRGIKFQPVNGPIFFCAKTSLATQLLILVAA
jgi:hypothetical protein